MFRLLIIAYSRQAMQEMGRPNLTRMGFTLGEQLGVEVVRFQSNSSAYDQAVRDKGAVDRTDAAIHSGPTTDALLLVLTSHGLVTESGSPASFFVFPGLSVVSTTGRSLEEVMEISKTALDEQRKLN